MPWRSPPERLPTVESTVMPAPRKPMTSIRICLRDLLLALDVDEAEAVGDLPADEEVAPQRLLLGQRLVLVDGFDREIVRHADRVFARLDLLVAHEDAARGRRDHAGHHLDQRRFAGAVVADEADDLVAADGQVDVAQRLHRAEILLHALQANNRREITGRRHCVPIPAFPSRKRFGSAQADLRTVFCLTMVGTSISNIILSFVSSQPRERRFPPTIARVERWSLTSARLSARGRLWSWRRR